MNKKYLIDEILEKVSFIETTTVRTPTHILINENMSRDLVDEYIDNYYDEDFNYDTVTYKMQKVTANDIGDMLGLKIIICETNEFKILEELAPDY